MTTTLIALIALSIGVACGFFLCALLASNGEDSHLDDSDIGFLQKQGLGIIKLKWADHRWALVDQSEDATRVVAIAPGISEAIDIAREQMFNEAVEESRKETEVANHG